ncbi:MAG: amidohydrolase family protein [Puniceicoccaceae bacterium]
MAKDTIYFDCFAQIGKWAGKDPLAPWKTEDLLSHMERSQIHGALVYANVAAETHPDVGNPIVDATCSENERLYPCWVGLPHQTGEFPDPQRLVEQMQAAGVRALKIYPRVFQFPVNDLCLAPLLGALQEAGMLLIVDRGQDGHPNVEISWNELRWVAETYPRLNILLHGVRWEATRELTPLAQHCRNIHFEFSSYQANRMLEYWCEKIGHEQLLFGTDAMQKSLGAARAYVDYSELTEEQRNAIAGGNLARLLKVQLPSAYESPPEPDAIVSRAMDGLPIEDQVVIDAHAHFTKKGSQGATRVFMNEADLAGVVARNARLGVDITAASPWTGIWTDYELGNEDTVEGLKEFPEAFAAYAVLDPNYIEDWDAALKYCYEENRMMGMKPYHPRQGIPYNDARYQPWWEYGNEHHLFAKMHPSDNFVAEMHDLATRFPNVNFCLAHSGWTWKHCREHVELCKTYPNCFCEITFTSVTNGTIEWMVEQLGSERVLYGSDAPMRDPFPQFGWVVYADISEADKRNILGLNMEKIIAKVRLA